MNTNQNVYPHQQTRRRGAVRVQPEKLETLIKTGFPTLTRFAGKSSLSYVALRSLLNGSEPRISTLYALLREAGLSPADAKSRMIEFLDFSEVEDSLTHIGGTNGDNLSKETLSG